jgi:ABC-2 type transport system permease protein
MTAMTATVDPSALDVSGTARIPLGRLIGVETRKLVDTRAGRWLLIAIGVITAAVITIFFLNANEGDRTFLNFVGVTATPQGFLLPVLGILLVTSEWSQRTALSTFTLMPVRGRVILAKVIAALLVGLVAIALALGLAAVATLLGGTSNAWNGIGADTVGKFAMLQASGVLQGLAFGLVFLNSAAAIVTYFVLPTAFSILASLWHALADARPWVDLGTSQAHLYDGKAISGEQWAQLGTGSAIWILLPLVLGLIRVARAEVK